MLNTLVMRLPLEKYHSRQLGGSIESGTHTRNYGKESLAKRLGL